MDSTRPSRPSAFDRKWFAEALVPSRPSGSLPPPPPPIGHPVWSAVLGVIAGALGGFVMLLTAQFVAFRLSAGVDLVALAAALPRKLHPAFDFPHSGFALAAVLGAATGVPLTYAARRVFRLAPRLLFFTLLMPILWLFVHVFVIARIAPSHRLPLLPLAVGAFVYGVFLAVVPPVRAR